MINALLRRLTGNAFNQRWGFLSTMVLRWPTGEIYLRRWRIIQTPFVGLYVHRIERGDFDYAMHNHPWRATQETSFYSLVFRGGYTERFAQSPDGGRIWPVTVQHHVAPVLRRFPNGAVHQIIHVLPNTWTLVLVGRRVSSWEFLDPRTGELTEWWRYLESVGRSPLGRRITLDVPEG